ncbi:MAG: hypothetical protein SFZ02_11925 [bacterium]|nr:hypothetical protein [bacterium]
MRIASRFTLTLLLLIVFTSAFIPTRHAQAATFNVCTLGDLIVAITTANSNGQADVINFNCSTTLNFSLELTILNDGAGITINANSNAVTFDGGGTTRFFTVNGGASLTLDGLTLQNGGLFPGSGGAIQNNGTLSITNSTLSGNSVASFGGAIYNDGTLTITGSTLSGNSAGTSGGAIYTSVGNTITISTSDFTNNSADYGGAILNNLNIITISDSTFTNNSVTIDGGAIYNGSGAVTITNSTVSGNSATQEGGAIYNDNGTVTITGSTVSGNSATGNGGAIFNTLNSIVNFNNSTVSGNSASDGGAIFNTLASTVNSQDTHYDGNATNNTCSGTVPITDNGGNTRINSAGCPGNALVALDVSALACNGNNAVFTINAGDGDFTVDGTSGNFPPATVPVGLVTLTGPAIWTDVTVTESGVNPEFISLGGITCPEGVITPPTEPVPTETPSITVTVLGCALDTADGVEIANAPDNTYCRILMKNGGVVSYSGAIPADLISLGVKLAVDVYRLEGGQTINTFPEYARICLAGQGRLFYMDGRNAPRVSVEMPSEIVDGLTCAWIPAPGTLILTN